MWHEWVAFIYFSFLFVACWCVWNFACCHTRTRRLHFVCCLLCEKKKYKHKYCQRYLTWWKSRCTTFYCKEHHTITIQTTFGPMNAFFSFPVFPNVGTQKPNSDVDRAKSSQLWQENSSSEARQGEAKVAHAPLLPWFSSPSCCVHYKSGKMVN